MEWWQGEGFPFSVLFMFLVFVLSDFRISNTSSAILPISRTEHKENLEPRLLRYLKKFCQCLITHTHTGIKVMGKASLCFISEVCFLLQLKEG